MTKIRQYIDNKQKIDKLVNSDKWTKEVHPSSLMWSCTCATAYFASYISISEEQMLTSWI
jgi:hypothetical protein